MSGPALSQEQVEVRRQARKDAELVEEATRGARTAERRAARMASVELAVAPLNKRVLHSRLSFRRRRAANKAARASRKANR